MGRIALMSGVMQRLFLLLAILSVLACRSEMLVGCKYKSSLCSSEETCVDDNLFGRCQSDLMQSYKIALDPEAQDLLYQELKDLVAAGYDWASPRTQCVLTYYILSGRFNFPYDKSFCDVRRPTNVVLLLQAIEKQLSDSIDLDRALDDSGTALDADDVTSDEFNAAALPDESAAEEISALEDLIGEQQQEDGSDDDDAVGVLLGQLAKTLESRGESRADSNIGGAFVGVGDRAVRTSKGTSLVDGRLGEEFSLNADEEAILEKLLRDVLAGKQPSLSYLDDAGLRKFIRYLSLVQTILNSNYGGVPSASSDAEFPPSDSELPTGFDLPDDAQLLDKKDQEMLGILNQGTGNLEHHIQTRDPLVESLFYENAVTQPSVAAGEKAVESSTKRRLIVVDGNRIYIRTDRDYSKHRQDAYALVQYLESVFDLPPGTFQDVRVNSSEVSFIVNQDSGFDAYNIGHKLLNASEIALVAMKHKKDVQHDMGVSIQEVGLGSGQESLPLSDDDQSGGLVVPTVAISGLVVGVLVVVFGAYVIRARANTRRALKSLSGDIEAHPSKDYEELCRQRMGGKPSSSTKPEAFSGFVGTLVQRLGSQSEPSPPPHGSKPSSVSSWSEEPVQSSMDISTGHMILSYMENHQKNKDLLNKEWQALELYEPDLTEVVDATRPENASKNRFQDIIPYDHTRVPLTESANQGSSDYINASTIYDHDPRVIGYIVTQGPLAETVADFWQMVWEQGSVVIVSLTKLTEEGDTKCASYWPESGSVVYNIFEVHLVSEHIWCEDYVVRSFYLKNQRTNETRTVTQFHFLSWSDNAVPASPKALLEFRRKVNKSYRGRACPIVVHCSDGVGRTGTYVLLDMVLNRINKGVKEINIAATLEHVRDQRMRMVMTKEQFEFVLICIAEEVQAVLKSLPQQ